LPSSSHGQGIVTLLKEERENSTPRRLSSEGNCLAPHIHRRRPKPHTTWHLDEVYLKIDGRMAYLWRAVDAEGEALDVLVQSKRNKRAALNSCASF
jgi:hypothetical protein